MRATVRRAHPSDAHSVAEVHVRTWQQAYAQVFPREFLDSLSVERRAQMWEEAAQDQAVDVLVAKEGGRVVGFASSGPARDEEGAGEVYAIYVEPERWGAGVGRALMERTLKALADRGYREAVLWVLEDNPRARRFYEAGGWRLEHGRSEQIGGVEARVVRYRLRLPRLAAR